MVVGSLVVLDAVDAVVVVALVENRDVDIVDVLEMDDVCKVLSVVLCCVVSNVDIVVVSSGDEVMVLVVAVVV